MLTNDTAFSRSLAKMSLPELHALWDAMCDGRLDATLPPRERLAAWYRRRKLKVFMERIADLTAIEFSSLYLASIAGADPEEILNQFART